MARVVAAKTASCRVAGHGCVCRWRHVDPSDIVIPDATRRGAAKASGLSAAAAAASGRIVDDRRGTDDVKLAGVVDTARSAAAQVAGTVPARSAAAAADRGATHRRRPPGAAISVAGAIAAGTAAASAPALAAVAVHLEAVVRASVSALTAAARLPRIGTAADGVSPGCSANAGHAAAATTAAAGISAGRNRAAAASRVVVSDRHVHQGQRARVVDAGPERRPSRLALVSTRSGQEAVLNDETIQGDAVAAGHTDHAAVITSINRDVRRMVAVQVAVDGDVLADRELAGSQRDGRASHGGRVERDRVAARCPVQSFAQGKSAAIALIRGETRPEG